MCRDTHKAGKRRSDVPKDGKKLKILTTAAGWSWGTGAVYDKTTWSIRPNPEGIHFIV
jgi:hypothetical protein